MHHTPYTLHTTTYTLHLTPFTLHPTPWSCNLQPFIAAHQKNEEEWQHLKKENDHPIPLHPAPYTHPTPYTLHPTPCTLHSTPYTLHPNHLFLPFPSCFIAAHQENEDEWQHLKEENERVMERLRNYYIKLFSRSEAREHVERFSGHSVEGQSENLALAVFCVPYIDPTP